MLKISPAFFNQRTRFPPLFWLEQSFALDLSKHWILLLARQGHLSSLLDSPRPPPGFLHELIYAINVLIILKITTLVQINIGTFGTKFEWRLREPLLPFRTIE